MRKCRRDLKKFLSTDERCAICDQGTDWNDKPLVLPIDHIDGNPLNNDPKNLRYLCPNCHSQTETFAGKNSRKPRVQKNCKCGNKFIDKEASYRIYCSRECSMKFNRQNKPKIEWPNHKDLKSLVDINGFVGTGKLLGVSDAAVHKRLKNFSE